MIPENKVATKVSVSVRMRHVCTFKEKQPVSRERACNVGAVGRLLCAR